MNKTNQVLLTLSYGARRIYKDKDKNAFIKINGKLISIKEPTFMFCRQITIPFKRRIKEIKNKVEDDN